MMMENCGITPVYNVDGGSGRDDMFGGGGCIWILFFFFILIAFAVMGNGFGGGFGNGGGAGSPGFQGYATRSDINEGFLFNNIGNGIQNLQTQLCNCCGEINSNISNGFAATQLGMSQGFNGVQTQMAQLGYNMQDCCCQINRNIDGVQYEMAKNTCDIINAGHNDTQRIIDTIQADKIDSLRTELQSAQLQLSQLSQTANIVNQIKPCPIPAYITCNPYSGLYGGGYGGYSGGNCGCGNSCC